MPEYVRTPGTVTEAETEEQVKPPDLFRVLMHNDNYTTMDFVVSVLQSVFQKRAEEAVRIMLNIHHKGIGMCGIYPAEIAETKIATVHASAQSHGFPLRCSMEPE